MYALDTFEQDGLTVKLYQDEDPSSPKDWDNLGELVSFPGFDYTFPDRETSGTEDDAFERGGLRLLARYLRLRGEILVPFRLESHGAQALLRATDLDDERPSGFIVTNHARVSELASTDAEYHTTEWIEEALRGELEVWSQYVEGDVYGYVVEDAEGNTLDSLWGLYGYDYAVEEAKGALRDESEDPAVRLQREAVERAHWANRDLATTD